MHFIELNLDEQRRLRNRLRRALKANGHTEGEILVSLQIAQMSKVSDIISTIHELRSK